jgi:hypothetical protein
MINLEKILKQDRQIRAMTGLNRKAFESLLPSFEEAYQQMLKTMANIRRRQESNSENKRRQIIFHPVVLQMLFHI